jgi:hypothetical protein
MSKIAKTLTICNNDTEKRKEILIPVKLNISSVPPKFIITASKCNEEVEMSINSLLNINLI